MVKFLITIAALFSSCVSRNQSRESLRPEPRVHDDEDTAESAIGSGNGRRQFRLRGLFSKPTWPLQFSSRVPSDAANTRFEGNPPLPAKLSTDRKSGKTNSILSEEQAKSYASIHESSGCVGNFTRDVIGCDLRPAPYQYYESGTSSSGSGKQEKSTPRNSMGNLVGTELLENVVDRLRSAEQRADTLKYLLLEQDEIANDLCSERARVRELEEVNQSLERRLGVLKIASKKELLSLDSQLQKKSQSLHDATVRLAELESTLQTAQTELTKLKSTFKIVQKRSDYVKA